MLSGTSDVCILEFLFCGEDEGASLNSLTAKSYRCIAAANADLLNSLDDELRMAKTAFIEFHHD